MEPRDRLARADQFPGPLLGDRRILIYLPRGFLGLMVMSYLLSVSERSSRLFSSFISALATITPVG